MRTASEAAPERSAPGTSAPFICFAGLDWWYHNRAHSDFQLMTRAARTRPVLLVNAIGMRMPLPGKTSQPLRRIFRKLRSMARLVRRPLAELPGFFVFTPVLFPFYGVAWARRLNSRLVRFQVELVARRIGIADPVLFVTLPTAWDIVQPMRRRALVFNRSDKASEFGEANQAAISALEDALLKESDAVVYVSRALMEEERPVVGARGHFLDHGVDLGHFDPGAAGPEPDDLRAIPRPRIGWFGSLRDHLVDFALLERLARELPHAQLVLVGDAVSSMERFAKLPNVHWLGFRPYEEIPRYGRGFDVAIMPWRDNDWIRSCNPIKLKEYLALGLPVVSTDFPEVRHYAEVVRIARDGDDFVRHVRAALAEGGPATPALRRNAVLGASWDARTADLLALAARASGSATTTSR
jgi:glycosyltransferase involved in cell wall biosynthesis